MNNRECIPPAQEISRRSFLKWVVAGLGSLMGVVLGGAGGSYFLSPLFRKKEESWVDIGRAADFLPGTPTKVEYVERMRDAWITVEKRSSAWVLTPDGKDFVVFDPRCTHLGCPYRWSADQKRFLCPCHNAVFDVDGQVVSGPPPRPLDRYAVKVVGGRLSILPEAKKTA